MSEHLRFHRGTVQTPMHRYTHPTSGREITVIGMIHVGEPGYYTGLREVIDRLEAGGAVVQCEGVDRVPCDERDSPDVAGVLAITARQHHLEKLRITALGWTTQGDAFGAPPHWQWIDLCMVEVIRRIGPDTMLRTTMKYVHTLERPCTSPRGIERYRLKQYLVFGLFLTAVKAAERQTRRNLPSRGIDVVLLDERTAVALDGLWSTDRDVVLIWGSNHLPALTTDILAHGYTPVAVTEWHTAVTLPPMKSILRRITTGTTPNGSSLSVRGLATDTRRPESAPPSRRT